MPHGGAGQHFRLRLCTLNLCCSSTPAGGDVGDKREELGRGKQQIIESKRTLYRVRHRTDQDVTSVRVAGDERESKHRTAEENTRQVGFHALHAVKHMRVT